MPTLLHLDASPRGNLSISRQLSAAAVAAWKDKYPGGKVIERDLTETEITFVDLDWITGAFSTPDQLTDRQKRALRPKSSWLHCFSRSRLQSSAADDTSIVAGQTNPSISRS